MPGNYVSYRFLKKGVLEVRSPHLPGTKIWFSRRRIVHNLGPSFSDCKEATVDRNRESRRSDIAGCE